MPELQILSVAAVAAFGGWGADGRPWGGADREQRAGDGIRRTRVSGAPATMLLVLVLYRLSCVNDLRFANLALAVADKHVALIYATTHLLS